MTTTNEAQQAASNLRLMMLALLRPRASYLREDLAGFSFKAVEHEIKLVTKVCEELESADLDLLSLPQIANLQQRAKQLADMLNPLLAFDPLQEGQNPKERHRQMMSRLMEGIGGPIQDMIAAVAYAGRSEAGKIQIETRKRLTEAEQALITSQKNLEEIQKNAETVLAALKEASGKTSVSIHSDIFQTQAGEHLTSSKNWLRVFVAATIVGLFLIWLLFIGPYKPPLDKDVLVAEAIYNVTSRLLIFSIITFSIYWSARNYYSHRHNYIVNKHRQNALSTFESFANAPSGRGVRDTILLQASQTIFSAQQTGYIENEPLPQLVSGPEIIKTIISQKE